MKRGISRRRFFQSAGIGAAAATGRGVFGIGRAKAQPNGRVVILGFDGVEPAIVREMMGRGDLPNFDRLAKAGTFSELRSTIPPQSPVAWTSFTTCKNPGGHNIYDFIRRDNSSPRGPLPAVGTGTLEAIALGDDGQLSTPAKAVSYRQGQAFWEVADQQGKRCKVLNVPFAFPGDSMQNGIQLCGLGVPDLRGTTSTFTLFSDAFSEADLRARVSGGNRAALEFDAGDTARVEATGPRDNRYGFRDPNAYTITPLEISVDRDAKAGSVKSGGKQVELAEGTWSEYLELEFAMSPSVTVASIVRFYPLSIGEQVRIYMTCQQFHPEQPFAPISVPDEYSAALYERYGLYKTIGWAFDTHALRQDALDEDAFLADIEDTMAFREQLTLDELDRGEVDLLISAWTATDRVGHMFWRFMDEQHPLYDPQLAAKYGKTIENTYRRCDAIVGRVAEKLTEDDTLMILSDHGFESWRTGFDVNTWLRDNGYLTVSDPQRAESGFLQGIDWGGTQAYAVGLSSVYLNQQNREGQGSVAPADAAQVIAEIKEKLLALKDDATGMQVLTSVYTRDDFTGEAAANAPDLSLGYNRYYQSSKACAKGAVSGRMFEPNDDKWSGEHAAADVAWIPGIFFSSRSTETPDPDIRDLGVTALHAMGCDVPSDYEGRELG